MVIASQNIEQQRGYKQTEVGLIPEDWEVKTVSEISDVGRGRVISHREILTSLYSIYPVYSSQTSNDGIMGYIDTHDFEGEYITWTTDGVNAGTVFYRNGCFNCTNVCGTIRLRKHNALFVAKILSRFTKRYVSTNLANPKLMNDVVKQILIPLPPTWHEQQDIATTLSDVDTLIASLGKLINKKRNIKQATMQQLLAGKTRLPGFSGEWRIRKLKDVAKIYRGASPRPIEDTKWFNEYASIGWVRISDITNSVKYLFHTTQNLSEQGVKQSHFVKQENLIMSICATVGKPIITKIDVCIHDGFVFFESPKLEIEYLYYYLAFIENNWSKNGQTGSQMNLNTTIIGNENISFPSNPKEQQAIATILSDIDAEIVALEQRRDKTRTLKQGMMQELLTGKTRLLP